MPKPRNEEQFPLLLFLVGDQDVSQNNRRLCGRGRFDGITSGASTIMTEWPTYLSSCWVTALLCGVTLFVMSMLLSSCMSLQYNHRLPRCVSNYQLDNKTIHLVHSSRKFSQSQLDLIENITSSFPDYKTHLIMVKNKFYRIRRETIPRKNNDTESIMMRTLFGDKTKTIEDLLREHPNILVTHTSYNNIFENTPLFINWILMNEQMRVFAIRALQVWQFGGLSFDLLEYRTGSRRSAKNDTDSDEIKLQNLIRDGFDRYEDLEPETVSIDSDGLHMECKTPCHAFFGKILMRLKKANDKSTPRSVLHGPLYTFCRVGVIDKDFCNKNMILF